MAVIDPKRLAGRGREVLSGFTVGQRAVVAVGVAAIVVAAMFLSKWSSKPSYSPLFTNLSAKDAAAITTKLDTDGVPYTLAEGGTAIQVPAASVYKERLAMAAASLPSGGDSAGYDLLDKQGLSTNDFTQHVDYQRAVQGELESTIEAIDGVDTAKVNLVIPNDDVFASDTGKPSASVLVKTTGGGSISSQQVQAITHLVASSVQGMTADEVTLTDGTGKVLSAPGVDTAAGADARLEQTTALQDQLQQAAEDMLDQALGTGHAVVRVNADVNLDSSTYQESTYSLPSASPVAGAPTPTATPSVIALNQATSNESYSGNGANAAVGVLGISQSGASPSTPSTGGTTGTGTTSSSAAGSYDKTINNQTNAINQRNTTTTVAPGGVRRLSVSVLLDQSAIKSGVNTAQLKDTVSQAVGLQASRGDTITLTSLPFNSSTSSATSTTAKGAKGATSSSSSSGGLMSKLGLAIPALGLILVLIAAIRGVRKVERTPLLQPQEKLELEAARRALAAVERRQLEGGGEAAITAGSDQGALPGRMADDLGAMADRQPDEVAALLRNWLAESK